MWIERPSRKAPFIQALTSLQQQVLIVRGARQVGKTSFVINALRELEDYPQLHLNLAFQRPTRVGGLSYLGRDFFGASDGGEEFLRNIALQVGALETLSRPLLVFIDEADRYPVALESIQGLAAHSDHLKIIMTGSNLENVALQNAATGRKHYFDLYPITFEEFLRAYGKEAEQKFLNQVSPQEKSASEHYHQSLTELFDLYQRLGGMPRILDTYLDRAQQTQAIPEIVADLVTTIEENVKLVLGDKTHLYAYEDVLRKLALLSMETLKFSRLQVRHVGRHEAKKLVNKTVGARVAHKVRLYDSGTDLSKYILFDAGVLNYLLNGSDLLQQKITAPHQAIQYETVVGNEIVARLPTRDDLLYWKSKRGAQVEYLLKSPKFMAIDVKSHRGDTKSLDSCAVFEEELDLIVKVSGEPLCYDPDHAAKITSLGLSRKLPLLTMPHYLSGRLIELCGGL